MTTPPNELPTLSKGKEPSSISVRTSSGGGVAAAMERLRERARGQRDSVRKTTASTKGKHKFLGFTGTSG